MIHLINSTTDKAVKFFKENLAETTFTKVTGFFDTENFLFTKYALTHEHVHIILEAENGDEYHFTGLNCGYGGTGPGGTEEILQYLGIDIESARKIAFKRGFTCDSSNDKITEKDIHPFFEYPYNDDKPYSDSGCALNYVTKANVTQKSISFFNPQRYNFNGLLNCIAAVKPSVIEYSTNKKTSIEPAICADVFNMNNSNLMMPDKNAPLNLVIRSDKYDILCYVDFDELFPVVNVIHSFIMQTPLYKNTILGQYILLSEDSPSFFKIFQSLLTRNKKRIQNDVERLWVK